MGNYKGVESRGGFEEPVYTQQIKKQYKEFDFSMHTNQVAKIGVSKQWYPDVNIYMYNVWLGREEMEY